MIEPPEDYLLSTHLLSTLLEAYGEEVKKDLAEYMSDAVVNVGGVKIHIGDQIAREILAYRLK
jgi:hypothetical protein